MEWLADLLQGSFLGQPTWAWLSFLVIVALLLVLDLGVLHRRQGEIPVGESLWLSAGYIAVALAFGGWVWLSLGAEAGIAYYTGFLVEKSLSLDNVFVISLIFTYFAVPRIHQHRVLFWGILGVIVLRGIMIGLGAALVSQFSWILYVFGVFLIATGIKMLLMADSMPRIEDNPVLRLLRRHLNLTDALHGERFFVKAPCPRDPRRKVWWATPLFLALVLVETADLIFAVDSVPAIFAITTDPFVVYTSNIFAILGLRALYFALAAMIHRFHYLKYALSAVLIFIGGKIFWNLLVGKMDPVISLSVTGALLAGGIVVSLLRTRGAQSPNPNPAA
ncbi:TerC family protein [Arenibaculum pallidiluteum]|uniref:TerC family protein n=1 Tax=Arenibaculum pallidiluteum TaxID=2812559 RepID=UPI001A95C85B|nr:TerC family protein [Arenibaculum pallidiluteum]